MKASSIVVLVLNTMPGKYSEALIKKQQLLLLNPKLLGYMNPLYSFHI